MNSGGTHELLLRSNGTAELLGPGGNQLWASDSDEEFQDEWAGSMFLNESDVADILEYLVRSGELTDRQADACMIEEEAFTGDEGEAPAEDEGDGE